MDKKKLKKLFFLCFMVLIVLIIATSCNVEEIVNKEEEIGTSNPNVNSVHIFEKLDYNNLTGVQKDYVNSLYANNVKFTKNGVDVYSESVTSGIVLKTITSTWPEEGMGNFIPVPALEELDRIEYSENWISVYINNAQKSDAKDYLNEVKKYNFNVNETKDDGDVMLEYKIYDEAGNFVRIRFFKESKELEIYAKKLV